MKEGVRWSMAAAPLQLMPKLVEELTSRTFKVD
jgi:hypothetical protein